MVLWTLSLLEWYAGRSPQALDHALAAHELTEQTQHPHARAWVGRVRGLIEADFGDIDRALACVEDGRAFTQASAIEFHTILGSGVLGRIELVSGDLATAGDLLRELPGRLLAGGMNDPTVPVWADAIETLVGLGELELARSYLGLWEQHAERLGSPWALASAWRCRGLVTAAEGDLAGAFAALERSLVAAEAFPLERGRALLCLGSVRRQAQQKRAAREALEEATAVFEGLGARLWAEKARAEMSRISGRRSSGEELTESELRVAQLAAQGRTNRQIAAELYMGMSTVEAHLSRVYRKLGVRRAELASRLATGSESVDALGENVRT
jgi:DNA-binding CsgD family transcriptional regulator